MNQTLSANQNVRNYVFIEELLIERAPNQLIWFATALTNPYPETWVRLQLQKEILSRWSYQAFSVWEEGTTTITEISNW